MSIIFDKQDKTLTLHTANTTYQMQIGGIGHLKHLYYGRRVDGACMDGLYPPVNHGFSPDYYDFRLERGTSPDLLPQEYTGCIRAISASPPSRSKPRAAPLARTSSMRATRSARASTPWRACPPHSRAVMRRRR